MYYIYVLWDSFVPSPYFSDKKIFNNDAMSKWRTPSLTVITERGMMMMILRRRNENENGDMRGKPNRSHNNWREKKAFRRSRGAQQPSIHNWMVSSPLEGSMKGDFWIYKKKLLHFCPIRKFSEKSKQTKFCVPCMGVRSREKLYFLRILMCWLGWRRTRRVTRAMCTLTQNFTYAFSFVAFGLVVEEGAEWRRRGNIARKMTVI